MIIRFFSWEDGGETYGPVLGGGKIGFRQMAGLIADYSDLTKSRSDFSQLKTRNKVKKYAKR